MPLARPCTAFLLLQTLSFRPTAWWYSREPDPYPIRIADPFPGGILVPAFMWTQALGKITASESNSLPIHVPRAERSDARETFMISNTITVA